MTPLLLLFTLAPCFAEPPVCETAVSPTDEDESVLDAFRGTLDGHSPDESSDREDVQTTATAVEVDEQWRGRVVPELRGTPIGAVRRRLGPPAVHRAEELGWEVSYGCLVLVVDAGAVAHVAVHHVPCGLAVGD